MQIGQFIWLENDMYNTELYVFHGKLVFIKITNVTSIMIYSDCKSIQCYLFLTAEFEMTVLHKFPDRPFPKPVRPFRKYCSFSRSALRILTVQ